MNDSMSCSRASGEDASGLYCSCCDLLVGLPGLHVVAVELARSRLTVTVESAPGLVGCPDCGAVAASHGRRVHTLINAPSFGRPVRLVWRKRTWCCPVPACPVGVFTEQDERVAPPRGLLSVRARWWALAQLRREHAKHRRAGPPARHELAHPVERGGPVAGGHGRRRDPLHRGPRPRGR